MQLSSLQVHNFRGIREFSTPIELHEYTLLVGPNNSGKSTVIDALRVFYEKDRFRFEPTRDTPIGVAGEESWIELGFTLTDAEYASLKSEYQIEPNMLYVRKWLFTNDRATNGKIFAYVKDAQGQRVLAKDQFYGTTNVQLGKFGNIIYIPALSSVDDEVKMTGPSALRDLVSEIIGDSLKDNPAYVALATQVDTFAQNVNTSPNPDGLSMQQFGQDLDSELRSWNIKTVFSFAPPSPADILKSMFRMTVQDQSHGGELNVDQFGSGFQRQFIYTLIKMRAKYQRPTAKSTTKDFQPDMTLLLFEEPEAFLHPQQQELLARELRKLAKDGTFQVVCTTHSSMFVSRRTDDISSIIRLQRDNIGRINKHQVVATQWKEILQQNIDIALKIQDTFKNLTNENLELIVRTVDRDIEMEEIKNFIFLNPDRSSLFFANSVLLVEGYTEYVLIQRLFADNKIPHSDSGFYILECMGKYKLLSFMRLLDALGIPHAVMHDDDQRNNNNVGTPVYNAAHDAINQIIEGNRTAHTMKIHKFKRDLETELDVKNAGSASRKPQHILYLYAQNKIKSELLDEFCRIVGECIAATKA